MTLALEQKDFTAINLLDGNNLTVTWDVGRRCNYDCTYCPPHRHDNFSKHATLSTLQKTGKFVFDYAHLMMSHKKNKIVNLNFTGGEPTNNPNFLAFGQWLRETYNDKYQNEFKMNLTITSNGAFGKKMADNVINNYGFMTISYHTEAHANLKKQVIDNIYYFTKHNFPIKINVMFHAEYWKECQDLCMQFERDGIGYVPRMIGEHEDSKNSYAHRYTEGQLQWMKDYWADKNAVLNAKPKPSKKPPAGVMMMATKSETVKKPEKKFARELGRPCCGSRTMETCSTNGSWSKSAFLDFAKFRNWQCSVNWFFLHIEQQTDTIWHHQTCQARFDGTRGPIGTITNCDKIIADLKNNLANKTMPIITCPLGPGRHCGCGMCTPKATERTALMNILPSHIEDMSIFAT